MFDIQKLKTIIHRQLGETAWKHIHAGSPAVIHGYVTFWLYGQECCWGINTLPPLLMQMETDQEFSTFEDLLANLCEPAQLR